MLFFAIFHEEEFKKELKMSSKKCVKEMLPLNAVDNIEGISLELYTSG